MKNELVQSYLAQRQNDEQWPQWLKQIQDNGAQKLNLLGFPKPREEDWKYTNINSFLDQARQINVNGQLSDAQLKASEQCLAEYQIEGLDAYRMVFVNGHFQASLSSDLPTEISVVNIEQLTRGEQTLELQLVADSEKGGWAALNSAMFLSGFAINVPDDVKLEKAIECVFIHAQTTDNQIDQYRNIVNVGKNAELTIIERYLSTEDNKDISNVVNEYRCDDGALVKRYLLQQQSKQASQFNHCYADIYNQSRFKSYTISLGGQLLRNEINGRLLGEQGDCGMFGVYAPTGNQHVDNFTQVEHLHPLCTSDELYKGVLDDKGKAIFRGRIYVAQDAQQTDAYQTNRNLLLSRDSEANTQPQLEIYADDVRCSHGATVGELDAEQLFYLQSRGLPKSVAQELLIQAFLGEVLDRSDDSVLKEYIADKVLEQLLTGSNFHSG